MRPNTVLALAITGALACAAPAAAQTIAPVETLWYASIFGGYQAGSSDLEDSLTFDLYDEAGSATVSDEYGGGGLFALEGGVRVWKNMFVGAAYTRTTDTQDVVVSASVPHPLFFDRPRSLSARPGDMKHTENAFHLFVGWMVPVNDRFDVLAQFGPSFINTSHEFVTGVTVTETGFPFNTATLAANTREDSGTGNGFNVGASATYRLTDMLGASGFVRYTSAGVDLQGSRGEIDVDAGGFQIGVGIRVAY